MEMYADLKPQKWARAYTPLLLARRAAFCFLVVILRSGGRHFVFAMFLLIQIPYIIYFLLIRPFELLQVNLIELVNEAYFLVFIVIFWALGGDESLWDDTVDRILLVLLSFNTIIVFGISMSKSNNLISLAFSIKELIKNFKEKKDKEASQKEPETGRPQVCFPSLHNLTLL